MVQEWIARYEKVNFFGDKGFKIYFLKNEELEYQNIYLSPSIVYSVDHWDLYVQKDWASDLKIGTAKNVDGNISINIDNKYLFDTEDRQKADKKYDMPSISMLKALETYFIDKSSWKIYSEREVEEPEEIVDEGEVSEENQGAMFLLR